MSRPAVLVAAAAVVAVSAFQLWISPGNPPGFFRDEAALAYNAHTIAEYGRDEYGARFPLYFSSFLDYKSPLFVYGLAGVFVVTGADREVARGFSAVCMLAAVLLVGWLAYRRTASAAVAVVAVVLGGSTPWLFEVGRIAFEAAMEPLLIMLALLAVERTVRLERWDVRTGLPVGLALGAITYVYAGGRILAPLLALALAVVGLRVRWRWLVSAWVAFAVTQLPLLVYTRLHPGALTRRFDATTFITDDMPPGEVAWRMAVNYLHDLQIWHYVVSGDPKPYAHTPGTEALLGASLALSAAGVALVLLRHRADPFWRYALAALAVSAIPAATTVDRFHAVRLAPFALMLVVVAVPALAALREAARRARWARLLAAALALAAAVQFAHFLDTYMTEGPRRASRFEASVPSLLARGWADGGSVYIDYDDLEPLSLARWHALASDIDQARVVRLADGGIPPVGAISFGRTQDCDYPCTRLEQAGDYWIARADDPADAPTEP